MAYGKLKVDTLTFDNSGSDVDVTISSLNSKADLNSPTFTGTPTVPGYAPLASPALTGTTTAVNITLSGNLVVNGTTTTVASTNTTITDNLLELNSGASSNANDCGIIIERGSTGDNAIFAWDESADKFIIGTTTGTASSTGNITITAGTLVTGTVEDSKGDVRRVQRVDKTADYTLVASDAGKCITSTHKVTVPSGVLSATYNGDMVTIINNSSSDITIEQGSGMTMYNCAAGDGSSGDRVLAQRGMATLYFVNTNVTHISGAGLS